MRELELHEKFEMETLDLMRRGKLLDKLVFVGGTMLRLCFNLPRYSVDLDFSVASGKDYKDDFVKLGSSLSKSGCEITDSQEKHFTYLVEFRRAGYPRRLKIEIRKEPKKNIEVMENIAFTNGAPELQVRLATATLAQMWQNKIEAVLDRREIRDVFDIEFLFRRGAGKISELKEGEAKELLGIIDAFKEADYSNTLGNLLAPKDRSLYIQNKFALLRGELMAAC